MRMRSWNQDSFSGRRRFRKENCYGRLRDPNQAQDIVGRRHTCCYTVSRCFASAGRSWDVSGSHHECADRGRFARAITGRRKSAGPLETSSNWLPRKGRGIRFMGTHTVHYYNPTRKSLDLKDGRKLDLLPGEIARTDALS